MLSIHLSFEPTSARIARFAISRKELDMVNSMTAAVRKATMWSIVLSVLMIAAGVVAICAPAIAGVAVTARDQHVLQRHHAADALDSGASNRRVM
jgi:hypothetical protein